jgi:hypothetical protein
VSPSRRSLMSSTRDLLEFRDTLPAEERSRLEARILYAHETLLAEAQQAARIAKLPLLPPDAVKKREWVKKRTHGKARCERCRNSWPSPRGEGTRGVSYPLPGRPVSGRVYRDLPVTLLA